MPDPQADPNLAAIRRVAWHALAAGIGITGLKFTTFLVTNSVATLSDALESIINVVAAAVMIFAIRYANRPADKTHPYGHGKMEFMAVGLEGWLILLAGLLIGYEAVKRLITGEAPHQLDAGLYMLGFTTVLVAALAWHVYRHGKLYNNAQLLADGKHLITDAVSTAAVFAGLLLVKLTGLPWLDPLVAILVAAAILYASWKLLWQSIHGLMDRSDPEDDRKLSALLDAEVAAGRIHSYHKARHRHSGTFHWIDVHLQVDGGMTVAEAHALASEVERRIEAELSPGNATAHIEPAASPDTPAG